MINSFKLIFVLFVFSTGLIFAGDKAISPYSSNYKPPANSSGNSISKYSNNYRSESSFDQNSRSGITSRNFNGDSTTRYSDGSYSKTTKFGISGKKITEYNSKTGQLRVGIQDGNIIRYDDGSYTRLTPLGTSNNSIIERDNLGNTRYGIQINNKYQSSIKYSDGTVKNKSAISGGYTNNERVK